MTLLRVRNALNALLNGAALQKAGPECFGLDGGGHGLAINGADNPAIQAVDQQPCIAGLWAGVDRLFPGDASLQQLLAHHPGEATAAQGRGQPLPLSLHQQIGGAPAAQFTGGAEQQSLVGALVDRFSTGLNRLAVGEGFDTAQSAGGVALFMATDPGAYGREAGLMGACLLYTSPSPRDS